jgi:hypothetical protein
MIYTGDASIVQHADLMDTMPRTSSCFGVVIRGGGWPPHACNVLTADGDALRMPATSSLADFHLLLKRDKR